jgi:LmbE family N-acetylglucosaminyl deacetylase
MDQKRVLIFAPHPDDAEFYAGGLIAKLKSEGVEILIITVTDGRCGTYHTSTEEIILIRKDEAKTAAVLQGAEIEFLGYPDGELGTIPTREISEKLTYFIRKFKPDIIIAQDAHSIGEVHPDHRALAWAASDAIHFSQLPNVFPQHKVNGLEPHFVVEKYFYTEDPGRMNLILDVSNFIEAKLQAMMSHQSQIEFLVEDVMIQAQLANLDVSKYLSGSEMESPEQALRSAMLAQASLLGVKIGAAYAEGYYYSRFHPYIETLLLANQ